MVRLLSRLPQRHYVVFLDNFFNSIPLCERLLDLGMGITGALHANRTAGYPLKSLEAMKKERTLAIDFQQKRQRGLLVARWQDNDTVTFASTVYALRPFRKKKRFSRPEMAYADIKESKLVHFLRQNMDSIDQMEHNVSDY